MKVVLIEDDLYGNLTNDPTPLLARMTVVPFLPLPREVLREVVELKLGHLARRLSESQRISASFSPLSAL